MSQIATAETGPLTPEEAAEVLRKHESMCWWVARRVGGGMTHEDLEDLASIVRAQFVRLAELLS